MAEYKTTNAAWSSNLELNRINEQIASCPAGVKKNALIAKRNQMQRAEDAKPKLDFDGSNYIVSKSDGSRRKTFSREEKEKAELYYSQISNSSFQNESLNKSAIIDDLMRTGKWTTAQLKVMSEDQLRDAARSVKLAWKSSYVVYNAKEAFQNGQAKAIEAIANKLSKNQFANVKDSTGHEHGGMLK